MGYLKNIKRNSTRPKAQNRPYVQSMYGKKSSDRDIRQMKAIEQLKAKLKEWNSL